MACKTCKQKNNGVKEELFDTVQTTQKIVIWVIGVWFVLGAYGLYTLISKFI
jgi:hypothetical protein